MGKEYIIRVQMKSGANRTFRCWGWSANDAYQRLKKDDDQVQYFIDGKEA